MIQYTIPFPSATDVGATRRLRKNLAPAGAVHDLSIILEELNRCFFGSEVQSRITWGRGRVPSRRRFKRTRHITLGSYCRRQNLITIHPNLDRPGVPRFFVEAIVFHEMCHEVAGEERVGGMRRLHTRRFRELERRYPMYGEAKAWARSNMESLFSARRR